MILDSGFMRILTPAGVLPRASPEDGMTMLAKCWYGTLRHEAAGNEDGAELRKVRIYQDDGVRAYDIALIDGVCRYVTRIYHGTDDESGESITDLTLSTGPRAFAAVELVPKSTGRDAVGTPFSGPNLTAAKATIGEVRSVASDEYYNAQVAGIKLALSAFVYALEYSDEGYVRYAGAVYPVRRVKQDGQRVELVCEVAV